MKFKICFCLLFMNITSAFALSSLQENECQYYFEKAQEKAANCKADYEDCTRYVLYREQLAWCDNNLSGCHKAVSRLSDLYSQCLLQEKSGGSL